MSKSKTGLMLVEDPEDTIKAMCKFKDVILNWKSYKTAYEEIKHRTDPIHEKHADTHFYTLSIYKLIIPCENAPKGTYRLSNVGKRLCECLEKSDTPKFQKILSTVLLNNPVKGQLFREFLKFVNEKRKRTKREICYRFRGIPGRTLIAWAKSAGLIEINQDLVWGLPQKDAEHINLDQFRKELIEAYTELSSSSIVGLENIFVEIAELRQLICIKHSWSIEIFDDYLRRLLDSPFEDRVRLYGAPPSMFIKENEFVQNNKSYIYIRIKV